MATRYLTARGFRSIRELEAYQYSHTTTVVVSDDLALAILVTEADTEDRAQFLAQYQSDRYASGLIFGRVFLTFDDARRDLGWID